MVIAAAQPKNSRELMLDREITSITKAVTDLNIEGVRISYEPVLRDVTYDELVAALHGSNAAYLFHFGGHGISLTYPDPHNRGAEKTEGYLLLVEDKITKAEHRLRADDLAKLLQAAGVRLAVLGACFSGTRSEHYPWDSVAGALMARDIPAVMAMQYEIQDEKAIKFSESFYGALMSGLSLDEATAVGRQAMWQLTNTGQDEIVNIEWGVPVLYSRLPDGRVFPERTEQASETAQQFRKVIDQTIKTINSTGKVVGIQVRRVRGGFQVSQNVANVAGELVGADLDTVEEGAHIQIDQNLGEVSGTATGAKIDEL
jgi:hypothetical protein